jgi:hypothetical protein
MRVTVGTDSRVTVGTDSKIFLFCFVKMGESICREFSCIIRVGV